MTTVRRQPDVERLAALCVRLVITVAFLLPAGAFAQLMPNLGGQRAGISAYQFLKIGPDARGASMGEAYIAVVNDVSALFWNPAGLVNAVSNPIIVRAPEEANGGTAVPSYDGQAIFTHTEWLVGLKHEFVGASYFLTTNDACGIAVTSLHTDDMPVTTETQPTGTGNYFAYGDFAAALTYSRKMTDQFSFGATVRYVRETIDVLHMDGVLVDLGTYYYMGLGTSRFAVVVSNFGSNVRPAGSVTREDGTTVNSFQSFSPPTMFRLGYALDPILDDVNRLTVSVQLNHPNDNAENLRLGVEYSYEKTFFLRAGVKRTVDEPLFAQATSTAEDFTLGAGVFIPLGITNASLDYAFANFNDLGAVHRISVAMTY